jgi:hypothetical protein
VTKFVWFDLLSIDAPQAAEFYQELFGWPVAPDGTGSGYESWVTDGTDPWAGIKGSDEKPGAWVPYVQVDDLDAASDRVRELGGAILSEAIPGPAGSSVVIADPSGARLALFVPAS